MRDLLNTRLAHLT